jgi:hypothetical protein
MPKANVTREQFNEAVEAVWSEIEYQNNLPRRTDDEAKEPAGFFTLARVYLRRGEDAWSDNAGTEACLPSLRKLSAILVRGMIYCGIRYRQPVAQGEPNTRWH